MIAQDYPWHTLLSAIQTPWAQSGGWNLETLSNAYYLGGRVASGGTQFAKRQYKVPLAAGTYTFDLWHGSGPDRGVYTLKIDTAAVGTIDGYSAGAVASVHGTIAAITVVSSGVHLVELVLATRNASSTNYKGDIQALGFTRTA